MKHISVYVGKTKLFVTVNSDGMKINVGVSVKN